MVSAQICFLGGGNMARSIIAGLCGEGFLPSSITVVDKNEEKLNFLSQQFHVETTQDIESAVKKAGIVILCIKPQSMKSLVVSIKSMFDVQRSPLILSIAAGITLGQIENWLGSQYAVVRAMPNTPALIGCGATALYANDQVSLQQKEMAEQILRKTGVTTWVANESLVDVTTAISGSGPAYFFMMMEHMIAVAVDLGLTEKQAVLLVKQTAFGASKMALESTASLSVLRQNVTSKGGVTAAALQGLAEAGFEQSIRYAIEQNLAHSETLSRQFGTTISHQKK